MVGHVIRFDEFPCKLHEINGQHIMTLVKCIHAGIFRWHLDLQRELGREPAPYSTSPSNLATTKALC